MPEYVSTVKLTNAHGTFTADSGEVTLLLAKTATWDLSTTRRFVADCCGFGQGDLDALRDCSWLELCIIWADSGNYVR